MDPRQQIAAILKQWLEKTCAEGQAIQSGDFSALRAIQDSKAELRAPLGEAVCRWRAQSPEEANAHPFRAEVTQLLALETHHSKRKAREKQLLLEQALFNLRRVRSSYAQPPDTAFNGYS